MALFNSRCTNKFKNINKEDMTESKSVNHYYAAAVLAEGYSQNILPRRRDSTVKSINTANLIKYIEKLNIIDRNLSDYEVRKIAQKILNDEKLRNNICPEKTKCSNIFKTPLLIESKSIQKEIKRIEENFLEFIDTKKSLDKNSSNNESYEKSIYEYIKLSYARCPKINEDYSINIWDIYNNFENEFRGDYFIIEAQANLEYMTIPDLAPAILVSGRTLAMRNQFNLSRLHIKKFNKTPFFILPFSSQRIFILYYGILENQEIIINKILKHPFFVYYLFSMSLMLSFKKIIYKSTNDLYILSNILKTIVSNFTKLKEYRQSKYLKFIKHLHLNEVK